MIKNCYSLSPGTITAPTFAFLHSWIHIRIPNADSVPNLAGPMWIRIRNIDWVSVVNRFFCVSLEIFPFYQSSHLVHLFLLRGLDFDNLFCNRPDPDSLIDLETETSTTVSVVEEFDPLTDQSQASPALIRSIF